MSVPQLRELWLVGQKLTSRQATRRATSRKDALAWNLVTWTRPTMDQDPKLTLDWALRCLERALSDLDDGPAERRVRRQFHQLLLAIERDAAGTDSHLSEEAFHPELARAR
jgi:hypothetical protein